VLSVLLGAAGFAAVLCLWFPSVLTTPELREIYDMTLIRGLIKAGLLAAFLCGAASSSSSAARRSGSPVSAWPGWPR